MTRKVPERYVWAADLLDVRSGDAILEIGCGYGHAIPLICEKLTTGKFTAIDRSAAMMKAAAKANITYIREGKAEIIHADLLDFKSALKFDKIFLFNINVFWMDPVDELRAIARLLYPDGTFFIFHQPPPGHELDEFERAFEKNLEKNGFHAESVHRNQLARSICLISKLSE